MYTTTISNKTVPKQTIARTKMEKRKCKKCPKGKYVYTICNATSDTVCETCQHHSYIEQENLMIKCLPCRECSNHNLMTDKECDADRNRQCKCKPGFYCKHPTDLSCDFCEPVSWCPPGKGVTRQHTDRRDTECSGCPKGTYSDVDDYFSSCKNHTSCEALGRDLNAPGTDTTDAMCGDFKACKSCPWMLPASLWAGLVVTSLIIFLALFIIYWRTKRQSHTSDHCNRVQWKGGGGNLTKHKMIISKYSRSPVLTPDILKYPVDCSMEKSAECQQHTHTVHNYTKLDCKTQWDCEALLLRTVSEKNSQSTAANGCTDSIVCPSIYQSEPQESEWND
ncbi:tumor necrosis factor receptor superfamily member 3-like isoform X2 [Myxocyprinus asiaticus]|uniref:tumor necrosis factor receptor superfamily member 3-like isoform X2 n=1 Tax=Myxocyprinus asiaticus TaxID=70543 RepID=UPI002222D54C|nr:tumor necrosis factor receptor superfamily member 3-like isoform X2 [Myxocyprinus asiaticus]